jgi:K+-transporting ATPase ATPase A chain
MNAWTWIEFALFLAAVLACVKPIGGYMARVYRGEFVAFDRVLRPLEMLTYAAAGVDAKREMTWKAYATACLAFNACGVVAVYGLMRGQQVLTLNPDALANATPDLAFNTAASFASNTNWQAYGGESTLSHLTQMLGLGVQNFVSAATGMAVLAALARGVSRRSVDVIGNFWSDLVRGVLYVLLPLSLVGALLLVSQGVVQSFAPAVEVSLVEPTRDAEGRAVTTTKAPLGPAASQIAIKQLGTNGGGYFGANSAHPLENPTPLSNFLELLAILLIPAALCYTFGDLVGDVRQGWALLAAMLLLFVPLAATGMVAEEAGNPLVAPLLAAAEEGPAGAVGNWEGKETRVGVGASALWGAATTAASNGSVNSMHDSFTPLGGLVPMWLMQLGEVIFGGVGSGLYGMLVFAIIAVFVSGLMVGRTPEYLGKKIEAAEMKLAALVILIPPLLVLIGTAISVYPPEGQEAAGLEYAAADTGEMNANLNNPGAHGFSEVLYAWSSAGNNNGSAFAGLTANEPFYNTGLAIAMFLARFALMVPVLAIAGSLARKKITPVSAGTLPTHTPLFVILLVGVVLLVGALTFVPALALGPVVEHLQLFQ